MAKIYRFDLRSFDFEIIGNCWIEKNRNFHQGSASGTGSPRSCGPGPGNLGPGQRVIIKSGIGTGTQIQNLSNSGPGLKSEKSGTGTRNFKTRDPGLGPGPRFVVRGIPGLHYSLLSRGLKKSGTRFRGLKIFRDTVPVPCRPLSSIVGQNVKIELKNKTLIFFVKKVT